MWRTREGREGTNVALEAEVIASANARIRLQCTAGKEVDTTDACSTIPTNAARQRSCRCMVLQDAYTWATTVVKLAHQRCQRCMFSTIYLIVGGYKVIHRASV